MITLEAPRTPDFPREDERRTHRRLSSKELSAPASIRIPNRPAVSLVDLSSGGALLDVPFPVRPNSRMTVEFRAAAERMMVPFRLLRCYVSSLQSGVHYRAAGEFGHALKWEPLLAGGDEQVTSRLVATLENFLSHAVANGRALEFDHLLVWVLDAARRGERPADIAIEIRLRLATIIPSLVIQPATSEYLPDPARCARFFGFDFRCERLLTTSDRRLLRATGHLLSILNGPATPPLEQSRASFVR